MGWVLIRLSDFRIVETTDSKLVCKLHCKWEWKESRILVLLIGEAYHVGTVRGSLLNLSNHNYTKSIFREERESGLFSTETIALWGNMVRIYYMSLSQIYCTSKQNLSKYFICFLWQWVLIHPSNPLNSGVKMHILLSSWLLCSGIIWLCQGCRRFLTISNPRWD